MSDAHHLNFKRFKALINKRAAEFPKDRDIRIFVETIRSKPITFGYLDETLERSYAANLKKMFAHSRGFNSPEANQSDLAAIPRAPFESSELDSHAGSEAILKAFPNDDGILFFEQGFIASTASWFHAFDQKNPAYACLSYMYDDLAFYYMSEYESRLTRKLNSNETLTQKETDRSLKLIDSIVKERISKYNSQPIKQVTVGESNRPKVLVIDQSYGDASTSYGLADDDVFHDMLLAAIRENPDSDIIVKTHPDTIYDEGKRSGYFTGLHDFENVYFFKEAINPYCLFDITDKVYVGTSGVGMEALLAGKEVICFGAPFYSGWGLTDDRQTVPHRQRSRTLAELFYFTYIWYTHYHTPQSEVPCEIEDVLEYVLKHRTAEIENTEHDSNRPPAISVITPVYNVQDYVDECILSLRDQTLKDIEIILVNDASTDNSVSIIRQHMNVDPRITMIDLKQNIGQGFARNIGIDRARGEYILFIDADDFLYDDTVLENLYSKAMESAADMTRAGKALELVENDRGQPIDERVDKAEIPFENSFDPGKLEELPVLMNNRHFWTFLYKRQFLLENDIKFSTAQWEERPFLTKALLRAEIINDAQIPSIVYRVRQASTARRAKSLLDVDRQLSNYELTIDLYNNAIDAKGSQLKFALQFSFSQILHSIFFGFIWKVLQDQQAETRGKYQQRIQGLFIASGLSSSDLTDIPLNIKTKKFRDYSYQYLFELGRVGQWELVPAIVAGKDVSAADVYDHVINGPSELSGRANQFLKYSNAKLAYPRSPLFPSSKPKLILHIGSTKTGSTFLQHFCDSNRSQLLNHGIWYPEFGQFWQEARPHKQAGHSKFIHAAQKGDPTLRQRLDCAGKLFKQPVHTVLLSSEAYYLMDRPERLVEYLDSFEISVLVYLRRQDEWANSQYAEFVAGGAIGRISTDIHAWLEEEKTAYRMSYDRLLGTWSDLVGLENVHVRRYGKHYFRHGDLSRDFLHALDINDATGFVQPQPDRENRSVMGWRHVQLMRRFNAMDFESNVHYLRFVDEVEYRLRELGVQPEQADMLEKPEAEQIVTRQHAGNELVARRYLHLNAGEPLFDSSPTVASTRPKEAILTENEVFAFFDAYASCHKGSAEQAAGVLLPPLRRKQRAQSVKPTQLSAAEDPRYLATEETITNRGYFRWRGRLKDGCARYARKIEPSTLMHVYYKDEELYRQRTTSRLLRIASRFFRSNHSAYGILQWRRQFTPLAAAIIRKLANTERASQFIANPIAFARQFDRFSLKLIGRIAYPMGEKEGP